MNDFFERYGPWALVSGASTESGVKFARQLAARGLHLVLTSSDADGLSDLAREIRTEYSVEVRPLVIDLHPRGYLASARLATSDIEVGLYVNADPSCFLGPFVENDLKARAGEDREIVALDIQALAALARELGGRMARRGRGAIVLLSADVKSPRRPGGRDLTTALAEALWYELAPHGVDVVAAPVEGSTGTGAGIPVDRGEEAGRHSGSVTDDDDSGAASSRLVARVLDQLGRASSTIPGRIHTPLNIIGQWIFSRDINERLQRALLGKAARAGLN